MMDSMQGARAPLQSAGWGPAVQLPLPLAPRHRPSPQPSGGPRRAPAGVLRRAAPALSALAFALVAAGCSVAPVYDKPAAPVPATYKEAIAVPESAEWKVAEPGDALARGEWWKVFGDAQLDELQSQAAAANRSLKAGLARIERARALVRTAQADRAPQVDAGVGATRSRPSAASVGLPEGTDVAPRTTFRALSSVSWEIDLFGRVASSVDAARADVEQVESLQRSLLLAIQADLAQNYLALRGLDAEIALLDETVRWREEALRLIERRHEGGEISELDVARSRTELAVARAERTGLAKRRAEFEHAIAVLVGRTPAELDLAPRPLAFAPIAIPPGLPSALLERRPDIAAAERAMAAANARIGIARAAYFPRLTLTGLLGLESGDIGNLFRASSMTWALGPLAGTALSMTLFDGGRRRANEAGARAAYEETAANYQQSVLTAVREVEDGLSGLRLLAQQAREQAESVAAARRAAELSGKRYSAGYVNYLEVIDAERQVLATQRSVTQIERERALATVGLIRALGGGWGT